MKRFKVYMSFFLFFVAVTPVMAEPVSEIVAQQAAINFILSKSGGRLQSITSKSFGWLSDKGAPLIYLFGLNNDQGFVLVAADNAATPILAYSLDQGFPLSNMSPEVTYWINNYEHQIDYLITNNVVATDKVVAEWKSVLNATPGIVSKPTQSVAPLLTTNWDQGAYYNQLSPVSGGKNTPTGCVATAMAMIMKYWNAPAFGVGAYSYNTSYGNLSADFGATTYEWSLMPNKLTGASSAAAKNAVATLMYHCGVAVRMNYAPGGSGAQVVTNGASPSALNAFKKYFGYKATTTGKYRSSYTDAAWISLLKAEMDASRPVLYAGYDNRAGAGHAFVFDGYDETDKFHINWGWSGSYNGYFTVDNLVPSGTGTGGGSGKYNDGQHAIVNIVPKEPGELLDTLGLVLSNELLLSQNEISEGDSFTVTAAVSNIGQLDYEEGYLQAEVYKAADGSFLTSFGRVSRQNLITGSDTTLRFFFKGSSILKAGDYFINIVYLDPLTGDWLPLADITGVQDRILLKVQAKTGTGIADAGQDPVILIYPNPARDEVRIDFQAFQGSVDVIELININGQQMSARPVTQAQVSIPVQHMAGGIYLVRIVTDAGVITRRITVQH